jgi:hypothetical protein
VAELADASRLRRDFLWGVQVRFLSAAILNEVHTNHMIKSEYISFLVKRIIPSCLHLVEVDGMILFKNSIGEYFVFLTSDELSYTIMINRQLEVKKIQEVIIRDTNLFLCNILLGK